MHKNLASRIYIFAKDIKGRFLFCNEDHAEIAGLDSPGQIIGKTDADLFWKKDASMCQMSDKMTIKLGSRVNVLEKSFHRYDGIFDIIISKYQLKNEKNECIGIVGSYYDFKQYLHNDILQNRADDNIEDAPSIHLSKREKEVLKYLAFGKTNKEISCYLQVSPRTIDFFVNQLKTKFQCAYKKDLIISAVKCGLIDVGLTSLN